MSLFNSFSGSFLVALPALFSIVSPLSGALIYHQVTSERGEAERTRLAWRVASYSAIVMLVSLWIGAALMNFFGVSIEALRIAGGLVVSASAWEMLSNSQVTENRKQEQAAPASGASDDAFFPLTMPFTTGPGTISVAIALSAARPSSPVDWLPFYAGLSCAALLIALTVGVCYASADRVVSRLAPAQVRILSRLSAFLLLCIGVQILLTGLQESLVTALKAAA